jgi:hypothetical protein
MMQYTNFFSYFKTKKSSFNYAKDSQLKELLTCFTYQRLCMTIFSEIFDIG